MNEWMNEEFYLPGHGTTLPQSALGKFLLYTFLSFFIVFLFFFFFALCFSVLCSPFQFQLQLLFRFLFSFSFCKCVCVQKWGRRRSWFRMSLLPELCHKLLKRIKRNLLNERSIGCPKSWPRILISDYKWQPDRQKGMKRITNVARMLH